jgi:hypothetical protein
LFVFSVPCITGSSGEFNAVLYFSSHTVFVVGTAWAKNTATVIHPSPMEQKRKASVVLSSTIKPEDV